MIKKGFIYVIGLMMTFMLTGVMNAENEKLPELYMIEAYNDLEVPIKLQVADSRSKLQYKLEPKSSVPKKVFHRDKTHGDFGISQAGITLFIPGKNGEFKKTLYFHGGKETSETIDTKGLIEGIKKVKLELKYGQEVTMTDPDDPTKEVRGGSATITVSKVE